MANAPNIVWIITDQQSAAMMHCAGNPYLQTPHMDFIAKHGTHFRNAYCANPVCQPSRFSLMTGLYAGVIAAQSDKTAPETLPLPACISTNALGHLLKKQGYNAVYGGKQNIPRLNAEKLGFDYICADERDGLADHFAHYIRHYQDDKPFAMVASFINPHDICLMAIDDFAAMADNEADRQLAKNLPTETASVRNATRLPADIHPTVFYDCLCPPLPDNHLPAADEPEAIEALLRERGFRQLAREKYTSAQWRLHRWAYAKLTESVDAQIGKLISALLERNYWDNTVIIFTSDHGDMDAAHKMEHKSVLYEECCRVPLLIKGCADAVKGQVDDTLVCNGLDCICTVMDYARLPIPDYLPGFSLKPTVETGENPINRQTLIVESETGIMAVDGRYKWVEYFSGANNRQFFDLVKNPGEMYNQLCEAYPDDDTPCNSAYQQAATHLQQAIARHRAQNAAVR